MIARGVVQNGVVVIEGPVVLPEGTRVRLELDLEKESPPSIDDEGRRQGGWMRGQIEIAPDFDELPDDIREAFGMNAE